VSADGTPPSWAGAMIARARGGRLYTRAGGIWTQQRSGPDAAHRAHYADLSLVAEVKRADRDVKVSRNRAPSASLQTAFTQASTDSRSVLSMMW
jgi:hypothetical protein